MSLTRKSRKLADYIKELDSDFKIYVPDEPYKYNHIGALITNIILQAGLNYNTVVLPRVNHVLINYPNYNTLTKFEKLISNEGLDNVINWKHSIKLNRMRGLLEFLDANCIDSCYDLKVYLFEKKNRESLLQVNGIGPKTLDYLLKLLNYDVVAVDRHIYTFVEMAEIEIKGYEPTKKVVEYAADFLKISRSSLDFSIWNYMSNKNYINEKIDIQFKMNFI